MSAPDREYLVDGVSINALPKVSLHDHLDGGLRPQTIVELADELGLELPDADAAGLGRWFAAQSNAGSLVEYLKTFEVTIGVMQTEASLARVAREFVEDLHADGVVYGEIRWAPEQHLRRGLSLDQAVGAVQQGIDQAVGHVEASGGFIKIGQLLSSMRQNPAGSRAIAELAVRHRDSGVVGFDIAGPEDGFPASGLRPAFDYLVAEWFPTTVHAGEAAGLDSIRSALIDGRALRLGHGVRLAEDLQIERQDDDNTYVSLGLLSQWVKDREIVLETSPSSNLQTGAVAQWGDSIYEHPFDLLYQLGFRVTVNTDNRLMSDTSLTKELSLLADAFAYRLDDIEAFQLNAAAGAFLPIEEREELSDRISLGFDAV